MPVLRSIFDTASRFSMPDLGISEKFGYTTRQPEFRFEVDEGLIKNQSLNPEQINPVTQQSIAPQSSTQPVQQQAFPEIRTTGQTSAGTTTPSNVGAQSNVQQEPTYRQAVEDAKQRVNTQTQNLIQQTRPTYQEAYSPIRENLDAQLEGLAGQRGELEGIATRGAEARRGALETSEQRLMAGLGEAREGVEETKKKTLRDLSEDIRNQMEAAGSYIGSRGAGDSSAAGRASEAIIRTGTKERGKFMEDYRSQLDDIEARKQDVRLLTQQKMQEIEAERQGQIMSISQQYNDIQRQLESQKARATSQERIAIAEKENDLRQQAIERISSLNDEARAVQVETEQWNRQRQAELEDFQARLAARGTYTGQQDFSTDMQRALDTFNQVADIRGLEYAQKLAQQQGFEGLTGYITGTGGKDKDPIDKLVEQYLVEGQQGGGSERTLRNINASWKQSTSL